MNIRFINTVWLRLVTQAKEEETTVPRLVQRIVREYYGIINE